MKKIRISKAHALETLNRLQASYPDAHCALLHDNPWQLLVATILSAQCTDVRVNMVTPVLFKHFPDPLSLAQAEVSEVEELIRSTGFFRNKAKSLIGCARALVDQYHGLVPQEMSALVALPGVGRKTANVVLGNAFAKPGMVVDTHVGRIAGRLGWATARTAEGIEEQLCKLLPNRALDSGCPCADFSWPAVLPGANRLVFAVSGGGSLSAAWGWAAEVGTEGTVPVSSRGCPRL